MHNEIVSFLNSNVSGSDANFVEAEKGDHSITVNPKKIKEVCEALKNSDLFEMNVLQVITATDYVDRIELCYILASFIKNTEFILKVSLSKPNSDSVPDIDSVVSVWKAADFQEREAFDMMGVNFLGHPDLRRILCPDDWEGFPLRKDYKVQEVYNGMVVNPEHKMNYDDHFFFKKTQEQVADPKKVAFSWKE